MVRVRLVGVRELGTSKARAKQEDEERPAAAPAGRGKSRACAEGRC
jgi:hypothetical protein